MVVLVPDFAHDCVKMILADERSKLSTEIPILEDAEDRERFGRASVRLEDTRSIRFGEEIGLLALSCGTDSLLVPDIRSLEQGDITEENEYLYFFTVKFE